MSCGNIENIKIEPVNLVWEIEEKWDIDCVADSAGSLNNKYFFIYNEDGDKFHVWLNVNSAGADPAPSNSTGIEVAVATGASAETIAAAIEDAINGTFDSLKIQDITYTAKAKGDSLITINYNSGATAGAEVVSLVGVAISIQIEDGVSTAAQIKTAVEASLAASALVSVSVDSGDESDKQASFGAAVPLVGGDNEGNDEFEAEDNEDGSVSITVIGAGDVTDFADNNTGFTLTQCQDGGSTDLGLLDGNVEPKFEEKLQEIMAHQTGSTILAELRQGVGVEVPVTLKECDAAHLKAMFARASGGTHTPANGTELIGWGKSRLGQPTIIQARRLTMHPVALADSNKARDLCFWKAYPMPESLVFSGEDPQSLGVTFKCYLDDDKPDEVAMFAYGDWSQLIPGA